jgi:Golgi phosphoprotein 3
MLTLLEEVVLLTINPQTGCLEGGDKFSVRYALAGAILFDLALDRRIDTDVDSITVIDSTPTGNPIQDELLSSIARMTGPLRVRDCVEQVFYEGRDLEGEALGQLAEKGIIRRETTRLLWVIDRERLRIMDGAMRQHTAARLAQTVLQDEIPDVRDIMLVSLASACGLLTLVLAPKQIEMRADWIQTLCKIETISRNVSTAIRSLLDSFARGTTGLM